MSSILDAILANPKLQALVQRNNRLHARRSPSKAHRWLICPGSLHVESDDPETEWAAEGTRKHAALERVLQERKGTSTDVLIAGDEIDTPAGKYKVPREVLEQCHEIADFIQMFKDTHGSWVVETESRVEIGSHVWPNTPVGECAGTVDTTAWTDDELLVVDAKFGFVQVQARGNSQLMLYALGLLAEIPFPIEWVTLCIAQPDYSGQVVFREHRISAAELFEWALSIQPIMEEIQAGSRRLQADGDACRYCPARTRCPARLADLERFRDENFFIEADLVELLPVLPRIRQICNDLEQRAMTRINAGEQIQGYKLVASSSKRKWPIGPDGEPDEADVVNRVHEARAEFGDLALPLDFYSRKLKSPAEIEKALRLAVNGGPGRGKMTVKDAKTIVEAVALKPKGAPRLVPASDPRPALAAATWSDEDILAGQLAASTFAEEGE